MSYAAGAGLKETRQGRGIRFVGANADVVNGKLAKDALFSRLQLLDATVKPLAPGATARIHPQQIPRLRVFHRQ
jgi:hypothetical protein